MHAGQGVDYLLRTVAVGDGDRSLRDPLTRYYTEEGTPPGCCLGSGVASLDSGLKVGDEVAEEQLRRLIGQGEHPVTGEQLGSRFRTYAQPQTGKRRHATSSSRDQSAGRSPRYKVKRGRGGSGEIRNRLCCVSG